MAFIPIYKYILKSTLSPEEIRMELAKLVNDTRPLYKRMCANDEFSNKPFCGVINDYSFKISRVISYGNPILPVIKGIVYKVNDSSNVKISMRLSAFTQIALSVWIFAGLAMCVISLTLFPMLMVLLGYICVVLPFNIEIKKDKKAMNECLCK